MHDYHFLISNFFLDKVVRMARERGETANSIIRRFVEISIWHIDYLYQNYGRPNYAKYEMINLNGQKDVHIMLTDENYDRIKWIHSSFNTYSMAQVVRRCIVFMFLMLEDYGSLDMAMKALDRMNEAMQNFEKMKDKHGFIQYPSHGIRHMNANSRPTYYVLALYVRFMKILLFGLPQA